MENMKSVSLIIIITLSTNLLNIVSCAFEETRDNNPVFYQLGQPTVSSTDFSE